MANGLKFAAVTAPGLNTPVASLIKFQPYSAWNEKGPRMYKLRTHQVLGAGRNEARVDHPVAVGDTAKGAGGVVVTQFGPRLQLNLLGDR